MYVDEYFVSHRTQMSPLFHLCHLNFGRKDGRKKRNDKPSRNVFGGIEGNILQVKRHQKKINQKPLTRIQSKIFKGFKENLKYDTR